MAREARGCGSGRVWRRICERGRYRKYRDGRERGRICASSLLEARFRGRVALVVFMQVAEVAKFRQKAGGNVQGTRNEEYRWEKVLAKIN